MHENDFDSTTLSPSPSFSIIEQAIDHLSKTIAAQHPTQQLYAKQQNDPLAGLTASLTYIPTLPSAAFAASSNPIGYFTFSLPCAFQPYLHLAAQLFALSVPEFLQLAVTNLVSQTLNATKEIEIDGGMPDLFHLDALLSDIWEEKERNKGKKSGGAKVDPQFLLKRSNLVPINLQLLEFFASRQQLAAIKDGLLERNLADTELFAAVQTFESMFYTYFGLILSEIPIGAQAIDSNGDLAVPSLDLPTIMCQAIEGDE